jgi:hypothetical protein
MSSLTDSGYQLAVCSSSTAYMASLQMLLSWRKGTCFI